MTASAPPVAVPTLEGQLRASARRAGTAPALLTGSGVCATHADLRRVRDGGRQRLREAGVRRGDHVVLVMSQPWELAAALLAVMSSAAAAALDPGLTDRELAAVLGQLRPAAVVADAQAAPRLRAVVTGLAGAKVPVLTWSIDELDGPQDAGDEPAVDDPALLLFTSGTTATPKVVRLYQSNLAAAATSIAGTLRLGPADRALNAMPLHHGHGIFPGTLAPLAAGGSTVCTRVPDADALLAVAEATDADLVLGCPGRAPQLPGDGQEQARGRGSVAIAGHQVHFVRRWPPVCSASWSRGWVLRWSRRTR